MEKYDIQKGDVVQLSPHHPRFPCFLVVCDEPKSWGCQGYLMSQFNFEAAKVKGVAYLRPKFEEFEYVGKIQWHWNPIANDQDTERKDG